MSEKAAQGHRLQRMQIIHDNSWDVMFDGYKRQQAKHNPYAETGAQTNKSGKEVSLKGHHGTCALLKCTRHG